MSRMVPDIARSVVALLVLFFVIVSLDDRVEDRFGHFYKGAGDLASTNRLSALGDAIVDAAGRHGMDSVYLIMFLFVSVVLALLMLRI